MDPISITASIITVLDLTASLANYFKDVKNATKEQQKVALEAHSLSDLLQTLRDRVTETKSSDPWLDQVKLLGICDGPLDQFKSALDRVQERTSSSSGARERLKSTLTWKFNKNELNKTLDEIERLKSLIQTAVTSDTFQLSQAIRAQVADLTNRTEQIASNTEHLRTHSDEEMRSKLFLWLKIPDPSSSFNAALSKKHPNTGSWLLWDERFADWKQSTSSSLIWLNGNAGSGKTVLSATAVQDIDELIAGQPDIMKAYFYFDFSDLEKQRSETAIRSLLFQIALKSQSHQQMLGDLYRKCDNGYKQPSADQIINLLFNLVNQKTPVYLIVDAIDECTDPEEFLKFIETLYPGSLDQSTSHNVHMFATSRCERIVEDYLKPVANYVIDIQNTQNCDIILYISDRLASDPKLKRLSNPVKEEIRGALMAKADGMFQYISCQLDALRQCLTYPALQRALSSLPKTLPETYTRILQNIDPGYLQNTIQALQWLCYSETALRLSEVVEILAIQDGHFDPAQRLLDPMSVVEICSSLISRYSSENDFDLLDGYSERDDESNKMFVKLAHFSVKEYLLSELCSHQLQFASEKCHRTIAESCINYLLHMAEIKTLNKEAIREYPLANYAARNLWSHVRNADYMLEDPLTDLILQILTNEDSLLLCAKICKPDSRWAGNDLSLVMEDLAPPLYYAASTGLSECVSAMLSKKMNPNARGVHGTALQVAIENGHVEVAELLLNAGADVNARSGLYGTALQAAVLQNNEKLVKSLLDAGADVNALNDLKTQSALSIAVALQGNDSHVKLLLEAGADVKDEEIGCRLLEAAACSGSCDIVQMLIDAGADVQMQGGHFGNMLQAASHEGKYEVVKLLLRTGVDINTIGGHYGTALQAAAARIGNLKIVQTLLDAKADVNIQGGVYGNALQAALSSKYEYYEMSEAEDTSAVVKMLLQAGADVNASGGQHGSALCAASRLLDVNFVQLLLEAGAEVNYLPDGKGHALQCAARQGKVDVVQTLIDAGADISLLSKGMDHETEADTALQAATISGNEEVVQMLLDRGADVNQVTKAGTALQTAAKNGHINLIRLLLNAGADVNAQGGHYGNALQAAAATIMFWNIEQILQVLLEAGASVNTEGGYYGNALQAIAASPALPASPVSEFKTKAVQMLLAAGADVNARGGHYGSALQAAVAADRSVYDEKQDGTCLRALLDAGADVNAKGGLHKSALEAALACQSEDALRMLFDAGADISVQGEDLDNALQSVLSIGNEKMAQVLIDKGSDLNFQGGKYGNALQAASFGGAESIVRMLLDSGKVNVNIKGGEYGTALQAASARGKKPTMRMLLDAGADVNSLGGRYGCALQAAACSFDMAAIKMLLNSGSDVNQQGGEYGTALHAVLNFINHSDRKSEMMVMLLDAGADVNLHGATIPTPLEVASTVADVKTLQMLLNLGADPNAQSEIHGGVLIAACGSEHKNRQEIVEVLLKAGAPIHSVGGFYGNALVAASFKGHETVVQTLLDAGADLHSPSPRHGSALAAASSQGHETVVKILLTAGADAHVQGGVHGNILAAASYGGSEMMVQTFLAAGADINAHGGRLGSALAAASFMDCKAVVQTLLNAGANINAQELSGDSLGLTPLSSAIVNYGKETARLLVDSHADPVIRDSFGRNAIDWLKYLQTDNELLQQLSEESESPPHTDERRLRQTIVALSIAIPEKQTGRRYLAFVQLGHCFLMLNEIEQSFFAFQNATVSDNAVAMRFDEECHICRKEFANGRQRFVCRICPVTYLCQPCLNTYKSEEGSLNYCRKHDFIGIPLSSEVHADSEATQIWLRDNIERYSRDEAV